MNDNIYGSPESELISDSTPSAFNLTKLSMKELNRAQWVSIICLILNIPLILVTFASEFAVFVGYEVKMIVAKVLSFVITLFWVYVLFKIKMFLEIRFSLLSVGVYIKLIAVISIIIVCFPFLINLNPEEGSLGEVLLYSLSFLPYGVINIILGKKILSIKEHYPYIKGFAWTTIIGGIFMASMILFLLAIPAGIISNIFIIMLFAHAKKELKSIPLSD